MYEVLTKFRVGDTVRVKHDLTYFADSVHGVPMKVTNVERLDVDGKEVVMYTTDLPDPVLLTPYNEDELVGANAPLPPRD